MANIKEVTSKIVAIENTKKITKAMELIAVSKMKKAQDRMLQSRSYTDKIKQVMKHLACGHLEYKHPYVMVRPIKTVGYLVVSTDKGLCGGLNNNLFKGVIEYIQKDIQAGRQVELYLFGQKAENYFKKMNLKISGSKTGTSKQLLLHDVIGFVRVIQERFINKKIDALFFGYNKFVSAITQRPIIEKLIPLPLEVTKEYSHHWDYIYEPNVEEILHSFLTRYIETTIFQGVLENIACEHAARMVAMKNATDSAEEFIKEIKLLYNKERQAAITKELSEIVGGASCLG